MSVAIFTMTIKCLPVVFFYVFSLIIHTEKGTEKVKQLA